MMDCVTPVLLVEDNPGDARLIELMLDEIRPKRFSLQHVERLSRAIRILEREQFGLVLLDLGLPDSQGLDTFAAVHAAAPGIPVVVLTGNQDEVVGSEAVQAGAQDYLVKDQLDGATFVRALGYAIERHRNQQELRRLNEELEQRVEERTRELAAEKERLAVTLSSIGDGVIATDTDGAVVLINSVARQLTGWSEDQAIGRPLTEVFRALDARERRPCEDVVRRVLGGDPVVGLASDAVLQARDGSERTVTRTGSPILDASGAPVGVVLVFQDQSERVRWEEERARTERAESLGVLAGGIAHDFNNILTGILGNVSLAKVHASEGDALWSRLGEAERALDQATRLVRQLMSLSRSGSPVTEAASILDIIDQSASLALSGSRVSYQIHGPDDAWAVNVDTTQISRVVQNLVINAEQAMPDGGELAIEVTHVTLTAASPFPLEPGRYVKVRFADEGVGIAPDAMSRIFDPYFTTKRSGTGLGLAVAYTNVAKHGGHITVTSQLGQGTTFDVYLPASGIDVDTVDVEREGPEGGSGRILVMDDEPAVKEVCAEMLRFLGYDVTTTADGEEAIERYAEFHDEGTPFDLVITDLTVPGGMGGKAVVERLRERYPGVRVVAASGYYNDPVMADFRRHGFTGALRKPFTTGELGEVVQQVLSEADAD